MWRSLKYLFRIGNIAMFIEVWSADCVAPSSSTAQAQAQLQSQSSFYPYNNAETVYDGEIIEYFNIDGIKNV